MPGVVKTRLTALLLVIFKTEKQDLISSSATECTSDSSAIGFVLF